MIIVLFLKTWKMGILGHQVTVMWILIAVLEIIGKMKNDLFAEWLFMDKKYNDLDYHKTAAYVTINGKEVPRDLERKNIISI